MAPSTPIAVPRAASLPLVTLVLLALQVSTAEGRLLRAAHGSELTASSVRLGYVRGRAAKKKALPSTQGLVMLRALESVLIDPINGSSNLSANLANMTTALEGVIDLAVNASGAIVNASEAVAMNTSAALANASGAIVNASEIIGQEVVNASEVIASEVEEAVEEVVVDHPFSDAVIQAFVVVGIAEAFDRSWIATVICVLQYGGRVAGIGSSLALVLQVFFTAGIGIASRDLFDYRVLHLATAGVLGFMAIISAWHCYNADPNTVVVNSKRGLDRMDESKEMLTSSASTAASAKLMFGLANQKFVEEVFVVFVLVFRAELGDQTQLAMISLQSTEPLLAVSCGALAAFAVMLASALAIGSILDGDKLRERPLHLISAITFGVFALTSLWQGFHVPLEVRTSEKLLALA